MRRRALLPVLLTLALMAACGEDGTDVGSPTIDDAPAHGEWLGGEPDWGGAESRGAGFDGEAMEVTADAPSGAAGDIAPTDERTGPATAGSVDDNDDYDGYLDYVERIADLGLELRSFDPSGRILVTVEGADGRPVAGSPVEFVDGNQVVATQRTDSRGRTIFLPHGSGAVADSYTVRVGDTSQSATPGASVSLTLGVDGGASAGVPVDVLFLLDVTGSMGDEVAQLTETMSAVADQLAGLPMQPDLRFAMTVYRDEGDSFVTATHDFTSDVDAFQASLEQVEAGGGGDTPEALDEAFAAALDEPSWRDPATTEQFVFLIADAAPHVERQVTPYTETMLAAAERGINVHSIAASSTDDTAEYAFRAIAQATGGRFVFLTYGAGGAALGTETDIDSTDYEVMSLDALVVRLVSESLSALTGIDAPAPSTTSTTEPDPQQQDG